MRISRRRPRSSGQRRIPQQAIGKYRVNQFIRAPELRVIDESNQNLGVLATSVALALAQERGLDLVEVSPLAQPPVAKIVDYARLRYQEEKEKRKEKAKQKKIEVKGIRLSLRIGEHDMGIRIKQAERFLQQDDKVRVEIILRGRERQHADLAQTVIHKFTDALNVLIPINIEQPLSSQGGKMSLTIGKK